MRVGVNTAGFGNIELLTHVSHEHVGASITTSHAELRAAMMAELPSLERAMEQHHLRLESLELGNRSGSQQQGGTGGNAGRPPTAPQPAVRGFGSDAEAHGRQSSSSQSWAAPQSLGLNVHA